MRYIDRKSEMGKARAVFDTVLERGLAKALNEVPDPKFWQDLLFETFLTGWIAAREYDNELVVN